MRGLGGGQGGHGVTVLHVATYFAVREAVCPSPRNTGNFSDSVRMPQFEGMFCNVVVTGSQANLHFSH